MRQSTSNLIFEYFLPPFEIENVIWFWHDSLCLELEKMSGRA